jgi:hypothetical protein
MRLPAQGTLKDILDKSFKEQSLVMNQKLQTISSVSFARLKSKFEQQID